MVTFVLLYVLSVYIMLSLSFCIICYRVLLSVIMYFLMSVQANCIE